MKNFMKYLTIFLMFILLFSCSNKEEKLSEFSFGSVEFKEPFVGVLKSRPAILVHSLKYLPFSWMTSDTVYLEKSYLINFNEECLRSKSIATIQLADSKGNTPQGVSIYYNGEFSKDGKLRLVVDRENYDISIKLKIDPSLGNKKFEGLVLIQADELDIVNNVDIQQETNIIDSWSFVQKIGWAWGLWLIWILALGLCVFALIKLLLLVSPYIIKFIGVVKKIKISFGYNPVIGAKGCPIGNGEWTGKRGNSTWIPDRNHRPSPGPNGNNPNNLTMGEILDKYKKKGVRFRKGEPDFRPFSEGSVDIEGFSGDRWRNFDLAKEAFAKKRKMSRVEFEQYMKSKNLTLHERKNCKTIDLVSKEVHHNIRHSGGISQFKKALSK